MMGVARPVLRPGALPPNTWWWVLAGVVMLPAAAPLGALAYGLVSGVVTTVPTSRLLELAANTGALGAAVTSTSLIIGGASAWLVSRTNLPGQETGHGVDHHTLCRPLVRGGSRSAGRHRRRRDTLGGLRVVGRRHHSLPLRILGGVAGAHHDLGPSGAPGRRSRHALSEPHPERGGPRPGRGASQGVPDSHPAPVATIADRRSPAGGAVHPLRLRSGLPASLRHFHPRHLPGVRRPGRSTTGARAGCGAGRRGGDRGLDREEHPRRGSVVHGQAPAHLPGLSDWDGPER